jgi:hypothetical protein
MMESKKVVLGDKRGKKAVCAVLVFLATLSILFLSSFVLADMLGEVSVTTGKPNYFVVPDDVTTLVNISVNNTDADAFHNITNITIVLDGVTFDLAENGSDTAGFTVLNFSTTRLEYGAFNLTNNSQAYIWFNVTGASPGRNASEGYNISLTFHNESHVVNSESNISVHVNDTFTVGVNGSSMDADWANVSVLAPANYTLAGNETGISWNISISNQSGYMQSNVTGINETGSFLVNWTDEKGIKTFFQDGLYYINITAVNNSLLDDAPAVGRIVNLDTTAPVVAMVQQDAGTTATTIVGDVTITEVGSNITGVCSSDSSEASFTGADTLTQTLTHTGLSCGTSIEYTVGCTDFASLTGNVTVTLSTDACGSGGSGSGGGGGGGSGPALSPQVDWKSSFFDSDKELIEKGGVTRDLTKDVGIKVMIDGREHHVGLSELTSTTATIQVESNIDSSVAGSPGLTGFVFFDSDQRFEEVLSVGDTKKFEVNGDNFYDLSVKLNSITGDKASITALAVHEEIPVEEVEETTGSGGSLVGGDTASAQGTSGSKTVIWILVIIVIVLLVWWWMAKRKK